MRVLGQRREALHALIPHFVKHLGLLGCDKGTQFGDLFEERVSADAPARTTAEALVHRFVDRQTADLVGQLRRGVEADPL